MTRKIALAFTLVIELAHVGAIVLALSAPCQDSLVLGACTVGRFFLTLMIASSGVLLGIAALVADYYNLPPLLIIGMSVFACVALFGLMAVALR